MHQEEIFQIGRQLKLKNLMRILFERCTSFRPTLHLDTVYRAFNDADCNTALLEEIRTEGKKLLLEYAPLEAAA